jgi:hypothetical protein
MSNQIVITSGAKLRDLDDVIIGTDGILSSLAFNVANGVPKLDENGKLLVSQLPNSVMEFKGVWNAATNTPTLVNGTGNAGDVWLCNVAGTVNFGAGPIVFAVGDYAVYTGTVWARSSGATGTVTSVGVSRDGNALVITGSPVTSSGTINLGFSGDNTQYINGAGNLTTFPTLITSIGLTMPAAFGVSNSPLTANGTIGVTALGYPSQYIRGDGTLADFPTSGGGGSSVSYYLNGGTSQGTIGGTTYYEMSKIANTGAGVDFSKSGDGFITAFLTDAGDPSLLQIPAGNWNLEIYASMSSNGGTPEIYAELYKYDGTTFTLISTSSNEILYDGVNLNLYTFAMAVPETTLTITDRLAIKLYSTNSGGKTTTIHTQNGHLCQIITTFTTGLTALNGLTAQVQYFGTGTSGSDFNIVSSVDTHTFNLPTASATKRGALSSADWSTFNGKQDYITAGTTLQYWRGDKTWQTLDTSVVPELTNLYFTNARARTAISLTTTGSTGASTYDNTTGVLNIPNYIDQYVGTVTSVAMTVPTGLSISGSPITSSGTLTVTFAAGYSIPTNASQTTWDTAYTNRITSLTVTGSSGASTLISNTLNIPTYTLSGLGGVPTSRTLTINGVTYDLSADRTWTITAGISSVSGTAPISVSTVSGAATVSITTANTTTTGALTSTDWNTFNGKQAGSANLTSLSGLTYASTSFVKMTAAGVFSLDTNTYALASALSGYLPLTGGTISSSSAEPLIIYADNTSTNALFRIQGATITDSFATGARTFLGDGGIDIFIGTSNSSYTPANTYIALNQSGEISMGAGTPATKQFILSTSGNLSITGTITGSSIIKSGGTSSQYLMADGSTSTLTNPITGTGTNGKLARFNGTSTIENSYITDTADNATTIEKNSSSITAPILRILPPSPYTNAGLLNLDNAGAGSFYIGRQNSAGNSDLISSLDAYATVIGHTGSQTLNLVTAQISRLKINGSGCIGINTAPTSDQLSVTGSANNWAGAFSASTTAGQSYGAIVRGGTNSTDVAFKVNNAANNAAYFNIRGDGFIGIGTTTPASILNIVDTSANNTTLTLGVAGEVPTIKAGGVNTDLQIEAVGAGGFLNLVTNGVSRMLIQGGGNTLINTTSGVSGGGTLQVNGNVNINGVFQINGVTIGGGGGSGVTGSGTNGYITKWTGSSTLGNSIIQETGTSLSIITGGEIVARFATSGDGTIIIGGTSAQGVSSGEQYITYQNGTTNTNAWMVGMDDGEDWRFAYGAQGEITDGNSLIRLTQGGNFIIGSVTDNGYKLQVNGSASFAYGYISIFRGSSGAGDIFVGNTGSTFYIGGNTQVAGSVSASGGFFDTSDARLKTLVEDNYLVSSIANVKVKLYIKDGRKELGYYAQDLQSILPSAVKEGVDGYLSLSYNQVHTAKIGVIEDEVTILKNRVSELETKLQKYDS